MKRKLRSKNFKQLKTNLSIFLFLISLLTFSQTPQTTTNSEIANVLVYSFFDEQVDLSASPQKTNYAINLVDDDVNTDWAAQSETGDELILNLGGAQDLAEIQYLTVTKSPSYQFQIWVSTDTDPDLASSYTNIYPSAGNLLSNQDNTYLQFNDFGTISGARFVKIKCFGRSDSSWNTISELKFYSTATASVKENELSGFTMYPNPSSNSFYLSNLSNKVSNIQILSLDGKIILSKSINSFNNKLEIDSSFLETGVYLIKLSDLSSNLNASKMLVIQ